MRDVQKARACHGEGSASVASDQSPKDLIQGGEAHSPVASSHLADNSFSGNIFVHEKCELTSEHVPVFRVGYLGGNREKFVARMDKLFGEGGWTIGYFGSGKAMPREEALDLYQRSYEMFFSEHEEYTSQLLARACDVYDTNVSNVKSGLDWHKQEDSHSHLQDIAVRRAVHALGLAFSGSELLQIRGRDSDLAELNPGRIPFVLPEMIMKPREFVADWVQSDSVEDFWQNNKFVFVLPSEQLNARLTREVEEVVKDNRKQDWKLAGEKLTYLLLSGEASEDLVARYLTYLERLPGGSQVARVDSWIEGIVEILPLALASGGFSHEATGEQYASLLPLFELHSRPGVLAQEISATHSPELELTVFCSLCSCDPQCSWRIGELFGFLLESPNVKEAISSHAKTREIIARSRIGQASEETLNNLFLPRVVASEDSKSELVNIISELKSS